MLVVTSNPAAGLEDLLADLVRVPSPNPPGDNRAISRLVAERLAASGAQVEILHPPTKPEAESVSTT